VGNHDSRCFLPRGGDWGGGSASLIWGGWHDLSVLVVAGGSEGGGKKSICRRRRPRQSPQLPVATYRAGAVVARDAPVPRTRAPPPVIALGETALRAKG